MNLAFKRIGVAEELFFSGIALLHPLVVRAVKQALEFGNVFRRPLTSRKKNWLAIWMSRKKHWIH